MASERKKATPLNQQEVQGQTPASAAPAGEQDDMLRMLGEFETGLGSLKQLFIQRQALQSQLKAREDELAQRDDQLAAKTRELETLMRQFEAQAHELDSSRADLQQREQTLAQQREELQAASRRAQEEQQRDKASTQAATAELHKQREALAQQSQELGKRATELDRRTQDLATQSQELTARAKELSAQAQAIDTARAQVEGLRADLSQREKQLATAQKEFGDATTRLSEMEKAIAQERERHAAMAREVTQQHDAALKQLDTQLQDAVASAKQWQGESSKWQQEHQQQTQALAQVQQQSKGHAERAAEFEKQAQYQQHVASDASEKFARVARRFDETTAELQGAREQLARLSSDLELKSAAAASLQTNLEEKSREVQQLSTLLDEVRACNASQVKTLTEHAGTIEAQARTLASLEKELAGVRDGAGSLEQRLHSATQELAQVKDKFNAATKDAASAAKAASQLREQNKQLEDQVGNLWQMISQEQASAADAATKWKAELEVKRKQFDESQATLDARARELASAAREIERLKQEAIAFAREREELSRRYAKEREQLVADLHAKLSDERLTWEKASKVTLDAAVAEARSQSQLGANEQVSQLTRRLDAERAEKHHWLTNLREVVEEYEQLWCIERGEAARLHEVASRLQSETGEADQVVSALRTKLREEIEHRKTTREQIEDMSTRLEEAAARIGQLEGELARQDANSRQRVSSNGDDGAERGPVLHVASSGWRSAESLERRDARLRLMRRLVREQADKVRKGSEALRRRYEQTEQVLKHRAELASARQRIIDAEQRLQSSKAKSKASVLMLSAMATVAILGGLSWALAQQLAPARFMASSMIAADGRGRELNAKELAEWKSYHEKVLNDPRFHQMAGERYARVGMAELSSPAAVKQLIDTRLNADQRNPGEMVLTLTGYGSTRTERELDVLTVAFTSQANAAQTARVDGSVTKIAQASKTGNEPLDNTRLYWALAMLGTGLVVCFGTALLLWKKLAGAKTKFEHDTQVAQLLDDAKWGTPDFIKDTEVPKEKQNDQQRKAA
jgi:chromosome segregation ATPase